MTFELRYAPPEHLHDAWEQIQEGLEVCRLQDSDSPWVEDIYACLKFGQAFLYIGYVDNRYAGFVVIHVKPSPFNGVKRLHVWFAYNNHGFDILEVGQAHLEKIAKDLGCSRITFRANRESFERLSKGLGYRLQDIEMVKELDNG
jgi:hypothetical protein